MEKITPVSFKLTSMPGSPILFNRRSFMIDLQRDPSLKKQKGEEDFAHQLRIYKLKCEYNSAGNIIIPSAHVKKAMSYSQGQNCHPIQPKGATKRTATLSKVLAAVFVDDITTKYTEADLDHFDSMVCIQNGMKKSSVMNIRPMLRTWEADLTMTIASDLVGREEILDMLEWCGTFCGLGDWRPERGGNYGRFTVK